jgi:hypothetical protein
VGSDVHVRVERAAEQASTVTCVIPGHDHEGTEVVAELLMVDTPAATLELSGRCGFETTFEYSG